MVLWIFPFDCFLIGAHNFLRLWVGINALEALEQLGLSFQSWIIGWYKHFEALGELNYSSLKLGWTNALEL